MRGYTFDHVTRKLTVHGPDGATPLIVPDSFPVLLLPTEETFDDQDAVFPDVPKGRIYVHTWMVQQAAGNYFSAETGTCVVSATEQLWSQTTVLDEAPAGANFFLCQVRLIRTVAPSHAWGPETIVAKPPADKWISLVTGSIYLEAVQGFSRALSVFVDVDPLLPDGVTPNPYFGKLILHQQQSVSDGPGGFGQWGEGEPAGLTTPFVYTPHTGGETVNDGVAGYPVYQGPNVAPQYRATSGPADTTFGSVFVRRTHRRTGSAPPSIVDPTNYGATWRLDIRGRFGRILELS